ncbi:AAHS family 4-hydroxybenzoate transporter-like MFS transporter [Paraburkholderia sp. 32]
MIENILGRVDVDKMIEGAKFQGLLIAVSICLFFTLLIDGMDFTTLGYLMPVVAKHFGASRSLVTLALSVSPIGGACGGFIGGSLGDRWGRRRALITSVILFGSATVAISAAPSMQAIIALRLIASVGLGAATPNIASLLSELLPQRIRSQVMATAFIGFPLGASLNGLLIPLVLPHFGWRGVVMFGGVVPLLLVFVLFGLVPESPGFLTLRKSRNKELATTLQKLRPDLTVSSESQFFVERPKFGRVGVRMLFSPQYLRDTLCLWVSGASNQFAAVSFSSWASSALTGMGFSFYVAVHGLMVSNFAGAIGALIGGWLLGRLGSRKSLQYTALLGVFVALGLFALTINHVNGPSTPLEDLALIVGMGLTGISIAGIQLGEYPLSTNIYPLEFRASGVGWVVAVSRAGAICSVSITGWVIKSFGAPYLFLGVAISIAVTFIALGLLKTHIPKRSVEQQVTESQASPV